MNSVFLYGTLRHLPLLRIVIGDAADAAVAADLPGHAVARVEGQDFPMIVTREGATAQGLLLQDLDSTALDRLDFYEAGFDYDRRPVTVRCDAGPRQATMFFPDPGAWDAGPPWDLQDWAATWGPIAERAATLIMPRFGRDDAALVARFRPQIWSRAASWVRAQATEPHVAVRKGLGRDDVAPLSSATPYDKYFALEEQNLRFRRFDGSFSDPVARAGFVLGDAVTVLPYDPVRDRVMVIEQFRFGPYLRGDRCPWSLEPIAGRIDAGETPQVCARREAQEEAGLALQALEPVAQYYPSPGAVVEYLFSYIGLADLPDGVTGIGGVDDEAEDIRSVLLSFDGLMDLLASGEAQNGPLILSALWLAANRSRLRPGA